jgi:hypothetical protein
MMKGLSVEYCGLAAKRAMNLSKYGLTEKQCSGQLSTPRVGSGWRRLHKRPSTVTAEIRGHQIPRVLWLADSSLVSLWYEFQENQVGRLTDLANLLFFKWTINESREHGLVNIIHTCLPHLDHLHIILFWLAYPLLNEYVEGPLRPIPH